MKLSRCVVLFTCAFLFTVIASAEEFSGTVKKVDNDKDIITITIDGKPRDFKVTSNATFATVTKLTNKKTNVTKETSAPISAGLPGIREGYLVTVVTNDEGKVSAVKVTGQEKAPPKKK